MSIILKSGSSGNLADVDANQQLKVALASTLANAGFAKFGGLKGDGVTPGVAGISEDGRIKVAQDSIIMYEPVDGTTINTNLWVQSQLTMTQAQASGFLTLNSGGITTINTYSILTSSKVAKFLSEFPLYAHFRCKTPNSTEINKTIEIGFGTAATTAAPTDGAFFRWNSAGEFRCVINNGGAETLSAAVTIPSVSTVHTFEIIFKYDEVNFLVDEVLAATIAVPSGISAPTSGTAQTFFARCYTGGTAPSLGPQLSIAEVILIQLDVNNNKLWNHQLAGFFRNALTAPSTFAQAANWANSTAPASATLSNTAAGYTTLGGLWQFAALAGAATDYALFGFQVPAGYVLHVTGIRISSINTGATVATTATILQWGLGVNSTAVSLATAGLYRVPLGMQGFLVGDLIGKTPADIDRTFNTPIVVESGRFLHVILTVPVGTATASEIFRGTVSIEGYFE